MSELVAILKPATWPLRLRALLGGPARTRVIVLFAGVLGLDTADLASLGAIAGQLKPALHLTNTQLGVLAAAPSITAATATLPMGVLVDRVRRVPLLAASVAVWAAAMALSGASGSFLQLLLVRLFLGLATAAAGPAIASLIGDLFEPRERGRVYGYVLAGQLLGSSVGLLVAGNVASASWRAAMWVLVAPSLVLAAAIWRLLPEPARGGFSRLEPGAQEIPPAHEEADEGARTAADASPGQSPHRDPVIEREVRRADVEPRPELVLDRDPTTMPIWPAVRYVLRLRTNDMLIAASALGYFFQAGVNTFGVVFVVANFGVAQSVATSLLAVIAIGALAGTVLGGRLADRLLRRGHVTARMVVAGASFLVSSAIFVPGLLDHHLRVAVPLFILAAVALAMPNAPLDAARLDIVPARLWGRAEAVRTVLRTAAVAMAPLLFGFISDQLARGRQTSTSGVAYQANGPGLQYTFLLMLVPMAVGGLILLRGARSYPRDVATALASDARTAPATVD